MIPAIVTLASGDSRPVVDTYPDDERGASWRCPWCQCPSWGASCTNPGCDAFPGLTADLLRERLAARASALADDARRQADHARARECMAEYRAERAALRARVTALAVERGACTTCLSHSAWDTAELPGRANRARFVRHRGPCPYGERNR